MTIYHTRYALDIHKYFSCTLYFQQKVLNWMLKKPITFYCKHNLKDLSDCSLIDKIMNITPNSFAKQTSDKLSIV